MIRKIVLCAALLLLVWGVVGSAQHMYVMYYSRSPQQDLEVNILNATSFDASFRIDAYDYRGTLSWQDTGQLAPNDSTFRLLSSVLSEGPAQWGVLLVVSDQQLVFGLEYLFQDVLNTIDVVVDEVTIPEEGTSYSLIAYHTEVGDSITALMTLNPFSIEAHATLNVRASDGSLLYQEEIIVPGHSTVIFNLAELAGHGSRNWGSAEIVVDQGMLAVACKYLKSGITQIDNISAARPVVLETSVSDAPTTETDPTTEKED